MIALLMKGEHGLEGFCSDMGTRIVDISQYLTLIDEEETHSRTISSQMLQGIRGSILTAW